MRLRQLPGRAGHRRLDRRPRLGQPWLKPYRRAVGEALHRTWSRASCRLSGSVRPSWSGLTFPNPG